MFAPRSSPNGDTRAGAAPRALAHTCDLDTSNAEPLPGVGALAMPRTSLWGSIGLGDLPSRLQVNAHQEGKTGTIVRWFGTNTDINDIRSARALAEEMASQSHTSSSAQLRAVLSSRAAGTAPED